MSDLFEVERLASRDEVASLLQTLAEDLADGTVTLEDGDYQVAAEVPGELSYELELETEEGEDGVDVELEVELEWLAGEAGNAAVPAPHHGDTGQEESGEEQSGEDSDGDATEGTDDGSTGRSEEH